MAISASQYSSQNAGKPSDPFHKLVSDLSAILGPSSGLDSSDVDVQHLFSLMEAYISNETEWSQYAFSDFSRAYTRNLVDEGNGKSNLLVLVWTPGKSSPIHDHANAHCLMRVLRGTLVETRFAFPSSLPSHASGNVEEAGLHALRETRYREGQVTYMSDALGLHRIGNASEEEVAISLHLYTPPNAAKEGCHIFNERTGKKSWVTQSNFYSEFGRKR